nr:HTTM domain-containing protein [Allostreptomyces psammosilenae]
MGETLAPYQSAVVRIGVSLTMTLFLIREWPHRNELYGPSSPWGFELAQRTIAGNDAFTLLIWSDSQLWFELVYHLALVASVLMLLGWHTRASSVLFMIGVLSLQNRSVFMGDGGDNVLHLMAIYLVLTRCGRVWSLDSRRARRAAERREAGKTAGLAGTAPAGGFDDDLPGLMLWVLLAVAFAATAATGLAQMTWPWAAFFAVLLAAQALWRVSAAPRLAELRTVLDSLASMVHNSAMFVIAVEVCVIYATAGLYKVQGSRWQDGTAVWYPMHLDYFSPWPALSELVGSNWLLVFVASYATVLLQAAFPLALLNRRAKNVLLVLLMGEHLGIAVLMGLPFFSMAMLAVDLVFLPTAWLLAVDRFLPARCRALWDRLGGRRAEAPAGAPKAAPGGPAAATGTGPAAPALPGQRSGAEGPGASGASDGGAGGVGRGAGAEPSIATLDR